MKDHTHHQYHFSRRTLQFLISLSLFSLFLCFSSGFSLFPKPLIFYINTGVFSSFSHYQERKYMFLICNGILAILAKSSVSSSKTSASEESQLSSTPDLSSTKAEANAHVVQEFPVESVEPVQDIVLVTEDEEEEEEEDKGMQAVAAEEEQEEEEEEEVETTSSQALVSPEEEEKGGFRVKQEEEEEEEGSDELAASTEELNRRIEEFIRKMKEEIRIEAQQQLIAV